MFAYTIEQGEEREDAEEEGRENAAGAGEFIGRSGGESGMVSESLETFCGQDAAFICPKF